MRLETSVVAEYTLENEYEYEVKCRILEDFKPLIDIRLSVGSRMMPAPSARTGRSMPRNIS